MKVEQEKVCGDPDITVQVLSFEDSWDRFEVETPFGRVNISLTDDGKGLNIRGRGQLVVKPVVANVIELGAAE